jgi:hypothetical protein
MAAPVYEVWVCPECGEQILEPDSDFVRGKFYGHYHDPPEGWIGPEDPWFDAVKIRAINLEELVGHLLKSLVAGGPRGFKPVGHTASISWGREDWSRYIKERYEDPPPTRAAMKATLREAGWREGKDKLWRCDMIGGSFHVENAYECNKELCAG